MLKKVERKKIPQTVTHITKKFVFPDNGDVFGWGNSEYSQLHMATEEQQVNSPVKLNLGDVGKVLDVASGGSMCMVLNGKNYLIFVLEKLALFSKKSSIPAFR